MTDADQDPVARGWGRVHPRVHDRRRCHPARPRPSDPVVDHAAVEEADRCPRVPRFAPVAASHALLALASHALLARALLALLALASHALLALASHALPALALPALAPVAASHALLALLVLLDSDAGGLGAVLDLAGLLPLAASARPRGRWCSDDRRTVRFPRVRTGGASRTSATKHRISHGNGRTRTGLTNNGRIGRWRLCVESLEESVAGRGGGAWASGRHIEREWGRACSPAGMESSLQRS